MKKIIIFESVGIILVSLVFIAGVCMADEGTWEKVEEKRSVNLNVNCPPDDITLAKTNFPSNEASQEEFQKYLEKYYSCLSGMYSGIRKMGSLDKKTDNLLRKDIYKSLFEK